MLSSAKLQRALAVVLVVVLTFIHFTPDALAHDVKVLERERA